MQPMKSFAPPQNAVETFTDAVMRGAQSLRPEELRLLADRLHGLARRMTEQPLETQAADDGRAIWL